MFGHSGFEVRYINIRENIKNCYYKKTNFINGKIEKNSSHSFLCKSMDSLTTGGHFRCVDFCVLCTSLPIVIFKYHIVIHVTKYQIRESHRHMTFQSCFSIFFSIAILCLY